MLGLRACHMTLHFVQTPSKFALVQMLCLQCLLRNCEEDGLANRPWISRWLGMIAHDEITPTTSCAISAFIYHLSFLHSWMLNCISELHLSFSISNAFSLFSIYFSTANSRLIVLATAVASANHNAPPVSSSSLAHVVPLFFMLSYLKAFRTSCSITWSCCNIGPICWTTSD